MSGLLGKDRKEKANVLFRAEQAAGKRHSRKRLIDHMPMKERLIVIEKPKELSFSIRPLNTWKQ